MTQKQLITANNAELEKHKQDILNLPMADDVKSGKWVWKKCKREISSVEVRGSYTESKANRGMLLSLGIALFDSNKKYIGKPNEEIFPGDATNVYILAPATDNNGHVIEGETVYHIVGYSMGNPNLPDVKKYNDFTIKYAENFLGYTVSDSETAYPDGGEKDGYWWERVKGGIDPALFGCTKIAVDRVTFSSRDSIYSTHVQISLGESPKVAIIFADSEQPMHNVSTFFGKSYYTFVTGAVYENEATSNDRKILKYDTSDKTIYFGGQYDSTYYSAGTEYTFITMA